MRKLIFVAAAFLFMGAAPAPTPLADFVRAVLPFASTNFAALRGAEIKDLPDTVYAGYSLRLPPAICANCDMHDSYAYGNVGEVWDVYNMYSQDPSSPGQLVQTRVRADWQTSPPEWSVQKTQAYVEAQLTPLLSGFSLRRTTSSGVGTNIVATDIWRNPQDVWVRAQIYPQALSGLTKVGLGVGHDLTKSIHVLRAATGVQLAQMQSDIAQFIRSGVAAAASDFSALRGPLDTGYARAGVYGVDASFGRAFRSCEIANVAPYGVTATGTNWSLGCSTFPTLGKRTSQEQLVRSAISNALPRDFSSDAADAKSHGYDYEWNSSNGVSVVIYWGDPQGHIVSFTVRIAHWVPK
jgi:hypothetical protein